MRFLSKFRKSARPESAQTLKSFVRMLKGGQGQHAFEYVLLLTLVMAGIMVMGPYVIRSWNANLKGWEDSVMDSYQDPLTPGDPVSLPFCSAGPWIDQGCNLSMVDSCTASNVSCAETEMTSTATYIPAGCNCAESPPLPSIRCTPNDCCCTVPQSTGQCGSAMTNPAGLGPTACSNVSLNPTNPDGTCPEGMMGYVTTCGSDSSQRYGCLPDPLCIFACLDSPVPAPDPDKATLCPGSDEDLTASTSNTIVNSCTGAKCEYECNAPCTVAPGGLTCELCPTGQIYVGDCPADQYDPRGCPAGYFNAGCLDADCTGGGCPDPLTNPTLFWNIIDAERRNNCNETCPLPYENVQGSPCNQAGATCKSCTRIGPWRFEVIFACQPL